MESQAYKSRNFKLYQYNNLNKLMYKFLCLLFVSYSLAACVSTPPDNEYAIALSSLAVAKKHEADKSSPKTYSQAIRSYKKGVTSYREESYIEARKSFEESILLSETAEFNARVQKQRKEEEKEEIE